MAVGWWQARVAPYIDVLQVPVTATFVLGEGAIDLTYRGMEDGWRLDSYSYDIADIEYWILKKVYPTGVIQPMDVSKLKYYDSIVPLTIACLTLAMALGTGPGADPKSGLSSGRRVEGRRVSLPRPGQDVLKISTP